MTVLIVGGSGFLGAELVRRATAAGLSTAATYASYATGPGSVRRVAWHRLDLRVAERVETVLTEVGPRVVVNASSGGADWAVTAEGAVRLAMGAAKVGCRLVRVSSDAVFSGARVHYEEFRRPDPVTPYGAAKAAAETGVLRAGPAERGRPGPGWSPRRRDPAEGESPAGATDFAAPLGRAAAAAEVFSASRAGLLPERSGYPPRPRRLPERSGFPLAGLVVP
ncbi:sugar nucleotide-binding protein [Streptomyces sp. 3MP-14]|uniref:Sugar nucleotide-binding protein n=1 Tax=Streptomyces mimosae TaxID=2586635 RepID=A0A5N6A1J9_9ACTN|nr:MULTISPECIES: sugar nucleotide-binding protein [Streptomyces]KAB8162637.1 sugar nucleotide-binding protein [Streptomyces mimosae]KAB8174464.1 sugar nucleotide-binding protein [Streptomyces sp. 3MP-14]